MGDARRVTVPDELSGDRADKALASLAGVSRSVAKELLTNGAATINGADATPRTAVAAGDEIAFTVPEPPPALVPEPVDFAVRYESEAAIVVEKPSGVVSVPGTGNRGGTLAAGLAHRWPELLEVSDPGRAGLVHRLDRDTSGLLLVARTSEAHRELTEAMARRDIERTYLALVAGRMEIPTGTVDAPIGRDPANPVLFAVVAGGRPARTHYAVESRWERASLLRVRLETGRTHQIRVHLTSIGHPIAGDPAYGTRVARPAAPRLFLHATTLEFPDPALDGDRVRVESPLPADLAAAREALGEPE